jgi:hypothetical protein
MVRGPMIGAVTARWLSTNAIAISISDISASSVSWASASAASSLRWFSRQYDSHADARGPV